MQKLALNLAVRARLSCISKAVQLSTLWYGSRLAIVIVLFVVNYVVPQVAHVGADALLVDAKTDKARALYQHHGFAACSDAPMTLYLPLG